MLIKIADNKNDNDPANDFPLKRGDPNLRPTIAAKQSDIIKISHELITNPLLNKRHDNKKPKAI